MPGPTATTVVPTPRRKRAAADAAAALLLVFLPLVALAPLGGALFTTWDDAVEVAQNPRFNPPTFANLAYYWAHPHQDLYIPVTRTLWMALAAVARPDATAPTPPGPTGLPGASLDPHVFHLANLAMHQAAVLALFALLRTLRLRTWPACAGAAVFAVHPVQVEPVAWVAGGKDVLCGLLSLVALWQYARFARPPGADDPATPPTTIGRAFAYALATVAFVLALLAKPTAMVVPLAALALDLLVFRRPPRRALPALAPWLVASIACGVWTHEIQPPAPGVAPTVTARPLVAADAITWYARKLAYPVDLCIDYGRRPAVVLSDRRAALAWIVPCAAAGGLWLARRRAPAVAAGGLLFFLGLLPVLGFIPFDFQDFSTVADHYLYLPMAGVALAVAAALDRTTPRAAPAVSAAVAMLVASMAVLSFRQSRTWHDSRSLFEHVLAVNPSSAAGYNSLAAVRLYEGDVDAAVADAARAVALRPDLPRAAVTLSSAYARQGRFDLALAAAARAVAVAPSDPQALLAYGVARARAGDPAGALPSLRRAVELLPDDAPAHLDLGTALAAAGRPTDALTEFRRSLAIDPRNPAAHVNLAATLAALGHPAEAAAEYRAALALDPTNPTARRSQDDLIRNAPH